MEMEICSLQKFGKQQDYGIISKNCWISIHFKIYMHKKFPSTLCNKSRDLFVPKIQKKVLSCFYQNLMDINYVKVHLDTKFPSMQ